MFHRVSESMCGENVFWGGKRKNWSNIRMTRDSSSLFMDSMPPFFSQARSNLKKFSSWACVWERNEGELGWLRQQKVPPLNSLVSFSIALMSKTSHGDGFSSCMTWWSVVGGEHTLDEWNSKLFRRNGKSMKGNWEVVKFVELKKIGFHRCVCCVKFSFFFCSCSVSASSHI